MNAGTVSRRALAALEAVHDEVEIVDPRQRQAEIEAPIEIDDTTHLALVRVFGGTGFLDDREKVRLVVGIRSEVRKHWSDARDSFLSIGRALVVLDDKLSAAEKKKLKAGMEVLFPFSDSVASKLRRIAREVDAGRISRTDCPGSYASAYLLSMLNDSALLKARERGLVRFDVTRREIESFRRSLKTGDSGLDDDHDGSVEHTVALADLRREERELTTRIRALLFEALSARKRRAEIRRILDTAPTE